MRVHEIMAGVVASGDLLLETCVPKTSSAAHAMSLTGDEQFHTPVCLLNTGFWNLGVSARGVHTSRNRRATS